MAPPACSESTSMSPSLGNAPPRSDRKHTLTPGCGPGSISPIGQRACGPCGRSRPAPISPVSGLQVEGRLARAVHGERGRVVLVGDPPPAADPAQSDRGAEPHCTAEMTEAVAERDITATGYNP